MATRFLTLQRALPSSSRLNASTPSRTATFRSLRRFEQLQFHTNARSMEAASAYRANGDNGDDGSTDGEFNQWKHRAPYKVHDNDPNFHARYEGSCHCGKVKYQLSREKPLDAKFCHCTTCQKIHGTSTPPSYSTPRTTMLTPNFQGHPFNGLPSSTRKTSISHTATMTSDGTRAQRKLVNISCPAKSVVPTAAHQSWMRDEI